MEPRQHRCSILGQTVPQIQPNDSARRQHLAEAVQTSGMEICMRIVFADERSPSGTQGLHRHLSSDDHHNTENFPGETTIKMYLLQHHVGYPAVHRRSPNSVEVIGGQTLRNTVFPPPSKRLSRIPHLDIFPKSNG
ncbi:uncharacterized protein LOC120416246 [Culex pipiens pallens]|nr:uncharacterized protein LOC120416246 [Culex pipiens pallens]